jgi:branched-chain amino acid transport system substrate-binding protein
MKSILTIVSVLFVLLLYGCGGGAPEVYRIGAVISLTGPSAAYGQNVKNGLLLAMSEINEKGGIRQKPVDLLIEDDGSNEQKAVEKATELAKGGVPLIIGGITSSVTLAMVPVCESHKVILLSPTASSPKLSTAGDYFFRNYPSDTLEGSVMAEYAIRRLKIRKVAILSIDNEYGKGVTDVFKRRFTELAGTVLSEKYYAEGTSDFVAYVKEIKTMTPDAIYMPGYYTEISGILKEVKTQGVKSKLMSVEGAAQPQIIEIAGDAAEGLVYPQPPYDPESNDWDTKHFVATYKAKYPTAPDIDAAFAYDAMRIVAKAVESCTNYPVDLRSRLADTSFKGITGDIAFDSNGDVNIEPKMFQIKDGKFTPIE